MIISEDKGHVRVHTCVVPNPIAATLVCIEVSFGDERRYRMRVGGGAEGRITVSTLPHYQLEKLHTGPGLYLLQSGWIAILVPSESGYNVEIGFARSLHNFYVSAPANTWYAAYHSGPVAFTYAAGSNATGDTRAYSQEMPTKSEILALYAEQHSLSLEAVLDLVRQSMEVA
jgi:hypothetical protein